MQKSETTFTEGVYTPGFLEKWGVGVIEGYEKSGKAIAANANGEDFFPKSRFLIQLSVFLSVLIGFFTTVFIVVVEKIFPDEVELWSSAFYEKWTWAGLALIVGTAVEFYLLFKLGLWSSYKLSKMAGVHLKEHDILITKVPNILSRIALEIPDPEMRILGIDPMKMVNKKSLLVKTFLYKLKVMLSNVIAKIVIRKIFARNSFRVYADYVAAPITGIWDGIVMWLILRELRIRLLSRILANEISESMKKIAPGLSEQGKICCLQAIGNSVVFAQRFHPNLEYMLLSFFSTFSVKLNQSELDDWDDFRRNISKVNPAEKRLALRLLSIACAFDGEVSSLEKKKLPEVFGDDKTTMQLIEEIAKSVRKGNLKEARELCRIELN